MSSTKYPREVYAIQHNITGRIYVGSSKHPRERYLNHIYALRGHRHASRLMQNDFDEYGEDYSLYILDHCSDPSQWRKEYEWMKSLGTVNPEIGYNQNDAPKVEVAYKDMVPFKSGIPIPNKAGD